jgi:hypothetical protein
MHSQTSIGPPWIAVSSVVISFCAPMPAVTALLEHRSFVNGPAFRETREVEQ